MARSCLRSEYLLEAGMLDLLQAAQLGMLIPADAASLHALHIISYCLSASMMCGGLYRFG